MIDLRKPRRRRAKRKGPAMAMPEGDPASWGRLEGDTLTLCLPLTPSQNTTDRLHWAELKRQRERLLLVAVAQVRRLGLGSLAEPWARRARIDLVRCSMATVAADPTNVIGGAKGAVDVLLAPRPKRPGVNLLVDDSPAHLEVGEVEDRSRGHWDDFPGPALWVTLTRLRGEAGSQS